MTDHGGGIVRTGLHKPLEDAANEILRQWASGITRNADKADVLTPWKEHDRRSREIYVNSGFPDGALRRGIFSRAGVDRESGLGHLSSVEGQKAPKSLGPGPSTWDSE